MVASQEMQATVTQHFPLRRGAITKDLSMRKLEPHTLLLRGTMVHGPSKGSPCVRLAEMLYERAANLLMGTKIIGPGPGEMA